MKLYVYGQTDLINNNVNKIALSDITELVQFIPKFNTEYIGVNWGKWNLIYLILWVVYFF